MNFHLVPKKRRIWPYLLGTFAILFASGAAAAYYFSEQLNPAALVALPAVKEEIVKNVGQEREPFLEDLPDWLGLHAPRTYLFLFLNNTELRPGGGFMGSYAVVTLDKGHPTIVKVDGTEVLDNAADRAKLALPPPVLTKYLGVDRWYFRDSNWSPDFSQSSRQTLVNYRAENGQHAQNIDAVVGVTTHVLEELMKISGPITIDGIEFTADNVVEKLEYEVEFGFNKRGIERVDRKDAVGVLFKELLEKLGPNMLREPGKYFALMDTLAAQKHILGFSENAELQQRFMNYGWAGLFAPTTTDYVLWVDANMAALKTDHALERTLAYSFKPDGAGGLLATATMTYKHEGKFDWRTSRYRTYTRVFVPKGAVLSTVYTTDRNGKKIIRETDTDNLLASQVFGAFVTIEPGDTKSLSFDYHLPSKVVNAAANRTYTLAIPKQLGAKTYQLTLDLNFGKTITSAAPAEEQKQWGNAQYVWQGNLAVDQWYTVKF